MKIKSLLLAIVTILFLGWIGYSIYNGQIKFLNYSKLGPETYGYLCDEKVPIKVSFIKGVKTYVVLSINNKNTYSLQEKIIEREIDSYTYYSNEEGLNLHTQGNKAFLTLNGKDMYEDCEMVEW
jgi:hypothetical protein